MKEIDIDTSLCVHLRGTLTLLLNPKSEFTGPIKKGLRLILWGTSELKATSCSFVEDLSISKGESAVTEIVVLSPISIDKKNEVGQVYSIGIPQIKLAEFKVLDILGIWVGKVP